jgi:hypothetical protein
MRQLDHPNIVKLIDFSESRHYYYIVLELCPGGELFHQIVRLTYFSEDLSRHVIVQVAKAIEYLHEQSGVVHRYGITPFIHQVSSFWLTHVVISNRRTSYSTLSRLFLRKIRNRFPLVMRTRSTRANFSQESDQAALARSRLQILAFPRLFGIVRL